MICLHRQVPGQALGVKFQTIVCPAISHIKYVQHALRRGYDLSHQRARQLTAQDFDDFDLVLVTEDGRVLITGGLEDRFEACEESGYTYEVIR